MLIPILGLVGAICVLSYRLFVLELKVGKLVPTTADHAESLIAHARSIVAHQRHLAAHDDALQMIRTDR